MPVLVIKKLPAINFLKKENIFLLQKIANKKYPNKIKVILLNLMFKKIETENQIIRLLSNSSLLIDLSLLCVYDKKSSNYLSIKHIKKFYINLEQISSKYYDGLIITGAPLGLIDFINIRYWKEFVKIIHWAKNHVNSILSICWSVQAVLNILYNIPKKIHKKKILGIFKHNILLKNNFLTKGFDDYFFVPHSRYSNFSLNFIKNYNNFKIISYSKESGVYLFTSKNNKYIFVTGHPEYDSLTIHEEYLNNLKKNKKNIDIPYNYYPLNNPNLIPQINWKSHGNLLFLNWLNYLNYKKNNIIY
ncbi:homoserine O-acetyltransferase/O-succinyltransferase family protein [Enterobacteriaceae endosymbiont of Donacia semicuprea]|uniref:homoserine O-acetyltransferase/O-succinyltransferase family protein n=1 Tax=Enterobacteriaceae endosymbiont of Donacia semicuprea TaxID=2675783 RepID=UPI001449110F|nr:homoserine O-succinyltransferase [Enterobacteriaceae endosymbiont of Donacia semicuprea]QJC32885.1 homoserine O-succinyltransferase [Enterobacteriaceae endosymbiont of Donacia semicuprea]